ncbi:MAG: radical SAM protein [Phycisphaerae bacterium]
MRPVENPPNPFASASVEWLGGPPAARLVLFDEHARQILNENDSPDIPFRYSLNPYRGCQHACAYCYARPTHEYLGFGAGSDFDTKICVKTNAPQLLDERLAKRPLGGESIAFSGVTDCYQPIEVNYQLTRQCLQVCLRHRQPVGIVTKSYLIVRDLELLRELGRVARVRVYFSVPFADDAVARLIEPHAPPTSRRFLAMRQFADAGIEVGAMVAPLFRDSTIATSRNC